MRQACIVSDNTLTAGGVVGAVAALTYADVTVEGVSVSDNTLTSNSDGGTRRDKVGLVVGRPVADTVSISATVGKNAAKTGEKTIPVTVVGSLSGGTAVITGGTYPVDPTVTGKEGQVASVAECVQLKNNDDGTYSVTKHWYGDGTADEFVINTIEEFKEFAQLVNADTSFANKTVKLGADLTFGEADVRSSVMFSKAFDGTFDGNGKTIKGLKFSGSGSYLCLFYGLKDGGIIRNLILDTVTLSGSINWTGGLVGLVSGGATVTGVTVKNLTVTPDSVFKNFGGIASYVYAGATISNCHVDGLTVTGVEGNTIIASSNGGIAGQTAANLTDCTVKNMNITMYEVTQTGGIVGCIRGAVTIDNCDVTGFTLKCTNHGGDTMTHNGGVVGIANEGTSTIKNCEAKTVSMTSGGNVGCIGGIVGVDKGTAVTVESCSVDGFTVHGTNDYSHHIGNTMVGGVVGYSNSGYVTIKYTHVANVTYTSDPGVYVAAAEYIGMIEEAAVKNAVIHKDCTTSNVTGANRTLLGYDHKNYYMDDSGETYVVKSAVAWTVVNGKETGFGSLQEAVNNADAGATVTLLDDATLTEGLVVAADKTVVLDLNSFTVSYESALTKGNAAITNNGTLTITDSSAEKTGKITYKSTAPTSNNSYATNTISNNGTLVIDGVVIENATTAGASYAIDNNSSVRSATTTINGNSVVTSQKVAIRLFANHQTADNIVNINGGSITGAYAVSVQKSSVGTGKVEVNVTGGTLTATHASYPDAIYSSATKGIAQDNVKINISGGTFDGNVTIGGGGDSTNVETLVIEGGTFKGTISTSDAVNNINISGGTFTYKPNDEFLADGYEITDNGNDIFGVAERKEPVCATVTGVEDKMTLSAALAYAKANAGTVITLDEGVTIDLSRWTAVNMDNVAFTLEGNGATITGLKSALIDSATTGGKTVNVRNLTIRGATNAGLNSSHSGVVNAGALFNVLGFCDITLSNVKVVGSTIGGDDTYYAGGLIGYVTATAESVLNVVDCSVTGTTLTSTSSVGGLFGHSNGGLTTITGTTVGGNTLKGGEAAKEGALIGTLTSNVGTKIDVVETDRSTGTGTLNVIGRVYTGVTYTGGEYFTNPATASDTNDNTAFAVDGEIAEKAGKFIVAKAKIGETLYATIQEAITEATAEQTITVIGNVRELGTEVESNSGEFFIQILDKDITLDLNGKTVNGSFYLNSGSKARFMNGTILNLVGNKSSGIESVGGNIVLDDNMVMTNSVRHAIRVKGGTAVIEGGTYAATGNSTYHVVNVSHASNVTIEGGIFSGNKGNSTAGGNALMIQDAASTVAIKGGTFKNASGGEGCISPAAGLTISGGTFDTWTYDKYLSKEKRYVAVQNADGMYDVGEATNWLQVADTKWAETEPYIIRTAEELAGFAKLVNEGTTFAGKTVTLGNDIDLSKYVWPGIGVYKDDTKSFQGTFDGAGKTISGVTFADASNGVAASEANNYRAFFNYINNATITDLTVAGDVWATAPASTEYGGALIAGHANNSTIEGCVAEGSVNGTHNVAGVVVRVQDSTIVNCTNKADLTGSYSKMGGIAALSQGSTKAVIDGCVNEGDITSTARGEDGVGGIIGWIGYTDGNTVDLVTVKNCENKGEITTTGAATAGQIAGESWNRLNVFTDNKGLSTMVATGHSAMDGLNFATVADSVATYVKDAELAAGNTYLVTSTRDWSGDTDGAAYAKPVIALAAGQSISFDLSLAEIDESGITAVAGVIPAEEEREDEYGTLLVTVTYTAAIAKVGETPYATIDAALAAAQEGDVKTVVVYGDAVWAEDFALAEGVTVQLADGLDETSVSAPKGYVWESGTLVKATNWLQVADTTWYNAEETEFTLDTEEELAGVAKLVKDGTTTFEGVTITLGRDMDLAKYVWPGIGIYKDDTKSFQGTFDGAGYKVSNMNLSDDSNGVAASEANNYRGFFNQIDNATVKDVTVAGDLWATTPASTEYGGALIAGCANNSTIEGCVAEGSANGTHNVAGVVVRVKDSTIKNCTNKADLTGSYSKMGGIAALVQNSETSVLFDGCVNGGSITCTARGEDGVGGIVGWVGYPNTANITVQNCENKGEITATGAATVGQIAAESWNGNHVFTDNKGLATMVATGHSAMDGLNFATVADGIATYVKNAELAAGNSYLVTAEGAKPVITLAAGESITFDQSLAPIDATGITAETTLEKTTDGDCVIYTAKGYVVTVTWPDETTTDEVAAGEVFTLPARTIEGSSFIGWSGDVVSVAETLSVTVEKSLAVTANYIPTELHTQMTNQVVVAYKDANELISIKDIQDMSLQNPTIEVVKDENGKQFADVGIKLMKATTLKDETNGGKPNWTPVVKDEPVEAFWADDNATMIIRLRAEEKAQFFRFVPVNGITPPESVVEP